MGANVVLSPPPQPPELSSELLGNDISPQHPRRIFWLIFWPLLIIILAVALAYELRTSALQAWLLPRYTARIQYEVEDGPSTSIAFPRSGPFDDRLGYSRIGEFQSRLEERGFEVERQAVVSPEMVRLLDWGVDGITTDYPDRLGH